MRGYETLPVPQSDGKPLWNFMVTARHRENDSLDIVFSFVLDDKEAMQVINEGFQSLFPTPVHTNKVTQNTTTKEVKK
jgi:hypothetical protein